MPSKTKSFGSLLHFALPHLLFTFTLACGTGETDVSHPKWAHVPIASSVSTINARLAYLQEGFPADFKNISVCIQNASEYNGSELLFETKLAYAAWLDASGQGSSKSWNTFRFIVKNHCNMKDNAFSSVVVIGEEAKISPDQNVSSSFRRSQISCKKTGPSANCSTGRMTLGLGGPGSIGYSYVQTNIWNSVTNRLPATVILSPFVTWQSLAAILPNGALLARYRELSTRVTTLTYDDIRGFNRELQSQRLIGQENDQLSRIVEAFLKSGRTSLTEDFLPRRSAYHVLLHEVGHQFGMDHADHPSLDSETGSAGTASFDAVDGEWETDLSTMAYADEYLYLTADDAAGIRDLASKNLNFISSHKP